MAAIFTEEEVVNHIKLEIGKSTLRKVAKKINVSPAYLSDVVNGNRGVSENMAAAFGMIRMVETKVTFKLIKKDSPA